MSIQTGILILQGNDEAAIEDILREQIDAIGDPSTREMNLARLDGRQTTLEELSTATGTIPFLADQRLVILANPLTRLESKDAQTRFQKLLETLPATTLLVLVIDDYQEYKERQMQWKIMGENHWLKKWIRERERMPIRLMECPLPPVREMPQWIIKESRSLGGIFSRTAAEALAAHVDNDTRLARQEIIKILTYVGGRSVEVDDVELLTPAHGQASIFEMVDALVAGQSQKALGLLHRLLETDDPASIFSMVVRQFRLLIQAREAFDEGWRTDQIGEGAGIPKHIAKHLIPQIHFFSLPQLVTIHHRLLEIDEGVKTSQMTAETALELLITDLACQRQS